MEFGSLSSYGFLFINSIDFFLIFFYFAKQNSIDCYNHHTNINCMDRTPVRNAVQPVVLFSQKVQRPLVLFPLHLYFLYMVGLKLYTLFHELD